MEWRDEDEGVEEKRADEERREEHKRVSILQGLVKVFDEVFDDICGDPLTYFLRNTERKFCAVLIAVSYEFVIRRS